MRNMTTTTPTTTNPVSFLRAQDRDDLRKKTQNKPSSNEYLMNEFGRRDESVFFPYAPCESSSILRPRVRPAVDPNEAFGYARGGNTILWYRRTRRGRRGRITTGPRWWAVHLPPRRGGRENVPYNAIHGGRWRRQIIRESPSDKSGDGEGRAQVIRQRRRRRRTRSEWRINPNKSQHEKLANSRHRCDGPKSKKLSLFKRRPGIYYIERALTTRTRGG